MRSLPSRRRAVRTPGHGVSWALAALVALAPLALAPGAAAAPRPTPGMGAAAPCSPPVNYTVSGRTRTTRPLPPATSRTGGGLLAAPGLQVTPSATVAPPAPKATAWLVADLDSGQVLAACNAHVPLAPA